VLIGDLCHRGLLGLARNLQYLYLQFFVARSLPVAPSSQTISWHENHLAGHRIKAPKSLTIPTLRLAGVDFPRR
jgi:hypothetical protein